MSLFDFFRLHRVIVLNEDPNKPLIFHYYFSQDELIYYMHEL